MVLFQNFLQMKNDSGKTLSMLEVCPLYWLYEVHANYSKVCKMR